MTDDTDITEQARQDYLEERARISQEVADGKIVVSYDEISPERWEKLGEMLEGAGFERTEGDLVEGLPGEDSTKVRDVGVFGTKGIAARFLPAAAVLQNAARAFQLHRALGAAFLLLLTIGLLGYRLDRYSQEVKRLKSDNDILRLTAQSLEMRVTSLLEARELLDAEPTSPEQPIDLASPVGPTTKAASEPASAFEKPPPRAAPGPNFKPATVVTINAKSRSTLVQVLLFEASYLQAEHVLEGLRRAFPSELKTREPTFIADLHRMGQVYAVSAEPFDKIAAAEEFSRRLCEQIKQMDSRDADQCAVRLILEDQR
jgi:hypothetical protein